MHTGLYILKITKLNNQCNCFITETNRRIVSVAIKNEEYCFKYILRNLSFKTNEINCKVGKYLNQCLWFHVKIWSGIFQPNKPFSSKLKNGLM